MSLTACTTHESLRGWLAKDPGWYEIEPGSPTFHLAKQAGVEFLVTEPKAYRRTIAGTVYATEGDAKFYIRAI